MPPPPPTSRALSKNSLIGTHGEDGGINSAEPKMQNQTSKTHEDGGINSAGLEAGLRLPSHLPSRRGAPSARRSLVRGSLVWEIWNGAPWEHLPGPPDGGAEVVCVRTFGASSPGRAVARGGPGRENARAFRLRPHLSRPPSGLDLLSPVIPGVYGMPPFFAPWTQKWPDHRWPSHLPGNPRGFLCVRRDYPSNSATSPRPVSTQSSQIRCSCE